MDLGVEIPLQLAQSGLDQGELLQRADAFVAHRGVGGPPQDPQPESQSAGLGGDRSKPGRLQDDGGVGPKASVDHGEGSEPAVLLGDHALQDQTAPQRDAAAREGAAGGEHHRHPGLHVAGAAAIEASRLHVARPWRCPPALAIARRHDVHVAVQDQGPVPTCSQHSCHQRGLVTLDLGSRKPGMGAQPRQVSLEAVDLQAGLAHGGGHPVLHRLLLSSDGGDPDQLLGQSQAGGRVQGCKRLRGRRRRRPAAGQVLTVPIRIRSRPSI